MSTIAPERSYWDIVRGLGGAALIAAVVGFVFAPLSRALLSSNLRDEVIIQGIPFVAFVTAAILLFILLVALVDRWLHHRIPHRTHRAVEFTLIAGILLGIVFLFQPFSIAPYGFGFGLLLFATLGFILWSHVTPRNAQDDARLPAFSGRSRFAGAVLGVLVGAVLFTGFAVSGRPTAPYGMFQRQWSSLSDERQADVAGRARTEYLSVHLPALVLYSLLPGLVVFFLTREALTPPAAETAGATRPEIDPDDTGPVAI